MCHKLIRLNKSEIINTVTINYSILIKLKIQKVKNTIIAKLWRSFYIRSKCLNVSKYVGFNTFDYVRIINIMEFPETIHDTFIR